MDAAPTMAPDAPPAPASSPDGDAGKAVLAAYRKVLDLIEADPELLSAVASSPGLELEAKDDGSIDVELETVSTTFLASELGGDEPAASPPMPPAA